MASVDFVQVDKPTADQWERDARADIAAAIAAGQPRARYTYERELLSEVRMHLFRGARAYVYLMDGQPMTLIVARFGKRDHQSWGRYVNLAAVHTRAPCRREGAGTAAHAALAELAAAEGCRRLVITAGSVGGWAVQRALDWDSWGVNTRGQIVTDTALTPDAPDGVPPRAEPLRGPGRPLSPAEHAAILTDPHGPYRAPLDALPARYRREATAS